MSSFTINQKPIITAAKEVHDYITTFLTHLDRTPSRWDPVKLLSEIEVYLVSSPNAL